MRNKLLILAAVGLCFIQVDFSSGKGGPGWFLIKITKNSHRPTNWSRLFWFTNLVSAPQTAPSS